MTVQLCNFPVYDQSKFEANPSICKYSIKLINQLKFYAKHKWTDIFSVLKISRSLIHLAEPWVQGSIEQQLFFNYNRTVVCA
jgi:hypothetical protein